MSRGHSETGPSGAEIWLNCHGSVALSRGIEKEAGEAAQEGTIAHDWCERALREGVKVLKDCEDKEMAFHAENYVKLVKSLEKKVGGFDRMWIEEKVSFNDMLWGSADFVATYKNETRMISLDYKYGKNIGKIAEENPQLIAYVLCSMNQFELDRIEKCVGIIYQPRAMDDEGDVRHHTYSKADLTPWKKKFLKALRIIKEIDKKNLDPNDYAVPGDWCKFCAANPCAAMVKEASERSVALLDEIGPVVDLSPDRLNPVQLSKIMSMKPFIMEVYKTIEPYMTTQAEQGVEYPGFKLIEGRSQRRWEGDIEEIGNELMRRGVKDPYNKKLKGLGEVEKEIGKNKITDLVVKPRGRVQLVPEEDARPALDVVDAVGLLDEI